MARSSQKEQVLKTLSISGQEYKFYDITLLGEDYVKLPFCLRPIAECQLRRGHQASKLCTPEVWKDSLAKLLDFKANQGQDVLFQPGRVLLQDFTGIPALVDLAALRDVIQSNDGDVSKIDSLCPADVVVDHSVQIDYSQIDGSSKASKKKQQAKQRQCLPSHHPHVYPHPDLQLQQLEHQMSLMSVQPPPPGPPTLVLHQFPPQMPYALGPLPPPAVFPPQQFIPMAAPAAVAPAPEVVEPSMPTDNPGLPIQDEVCPFHQRMSYWAEMLQKSQDQEFKRNGERFGFLKWVDQAFKNITVIPPGTGVMHQVNLEYLARVVTCQKGLLFPDSLIGTDAHTTSVNGQGVLGWCVGTMEAESVMFGHPITISIPKVVGIRIVGQIPAFTTSTEIVLLITKKLRHANVNGAFVEFFGPGIGNLSIADRATIANMCPEYGALVGYFPLDHNTLQYLQHTGRDRQKLEFIQEYLERVKMLRNDDDPDPDYSDILEINLNDVQPCLSGPKRCKDKVMVDKVRTEFGKQLTQTSDEVQGFGLGPEEIFNSLTVNIDGILHNLSHGSVLLAAITSCSNTSNPSVMLGAGLLAKKAIEAGLSVPKYVRRSLAPGSGIITSYLQESGVMPYFHMLGFEVVGYGCSACVDNHKPLSEAILRSVHEANLVCCGLLSGNRNFEGRIQPEIKANFLASPMMVIAYAIAGRIDIDFDNEPLGFGANDNKPIYLRDVWPSRTDIQDVENKFVIPSVFRQVFSRIAYGNKHWSCLQSPETDLYAWNTKSTFIQVPEYLQEAWDEARSGKVVEESLKKMRCLVKLGDDITADQISPAGSIVRNSPAADYLAEQGLAPRDYNSYGSRRGNCQVMMRGTFAHIRLQNQLSDKVGPYTTHLPSGVSTSIFEASQRYKKDKVPLVVIAGENFGRGAPRDWATKGPLLLGIKAVLAVSFDPSYRANLVKTGILPVEIDRTTYDILTGRELLEIGLPDLAKARRAKRLEAALILNGEFDLKAKVRLDNSYEVDLFRNGGVLRQFLQTCL